MENAIRIKEENIKQEYLAKLKRTLLDNIYDYLFGENGLEYLVKSNIESDMNKNIGSIKDMVAEEYAVRVENRIMELEKIITNEENDLHQSYTDYTDTIFELTEIKKKLEEEIAS